MTFAELVDGIRKEQALGREVPGFDPDNGNEQARYLFLLEAPGPKAVHTGCISLSNPDPTARNLRRQFHQVGIEAEDIAVWNVVPWYLGDSQRKKIRGATSADVLAGVKYVSAVVAAMPNLECIVLVGSAARKAHVFLSAVTTARILSCHHPSAQALNANPAAEEENMAVFRFMKASH
jgi:uracil-DNA glycosylase